MTREEVVKWLESLRKETGKAENRTLWHYAESIDMAIKALKEKNRSDSLVRDDAENCKESERKLDLIRRSDAIEAVRTAKAVFDTTLEPYIKPQDAVDALSALPSAEAIHKPDYSYEAGMVRRLKEALSAEARPTGEWIQKDMYADRFCSECDYAVRDSEAEEYNFCPNCGAKMTPYKGGDDE